MADDFIEPHLILHDEISYPNFYDVQSIIPENQKFASCTYSVNGKLISPTIFYPIHITSTDFRHNCPMDMCALRHAKKKGGAYVPDLTGLKHVLNHIKRNPAVYNKYLRAELQCFELAIYRTCSEGLGKQAQGSLQVPLLVLKNHMKVTYGY